MERHNARNWKVGDILDATFRYSMAIPAFYVVTRITNSTVWAKKLGCLYAPDDRYGQSGRAVPNMNVVGDVQEKHRIDKFGRARFNDSYTTLWDGNPVRYYGD